MSHSQHKRSEQGRLAACAASLPATRPAHLDVRGTAGQMTMAAIDETTLADWLRDKARINEKIMDKTLLSLEQQEVFDLQDLKKLREVSGLEKCFTEVTAAKISEALDALDALSINDANDSLSKAPQGAEVERPAFQGPEARMPEGGAASNPQAGKVEAAEGGAIGGERRVGESKLTRPQTDEVETEHYSNNAVTSQVPHLASSSVLDVSEGSPPSTSASSHASDPPPEPDDLPPGLTYWMERAYAECETQADRDAMERLVCARIDAAADDDTLFSIVWIAEPHPTLAHGNRQADPAQLALEATAAESGDELERILAYVRAKRRPPGRDRKRARARRGTLDSHLPSFAQLSGELWEEARALPSALALSAMEGTRDEEQWSAFLTRVLPQPTNFLSGSIHNEEQHGPAYSVAAPAARRAAQLTALGWAGGLPDKKRLL
jgi:hypothetical protein